MQRRTAGGGLDGAADVVDGIVGVAAEVFARALHLAGRIVQACTQWHRSWTVRTQHLHMMRAAPACCHPRRPPGAAPTRGLHWSGRVVCDIGGSCIGSICKVRMDRCRCIKNAARVPLRTSDDGVLHVEGSVLDGVPGVAGGVLDAAAHGAGSALAGSAGRGSGSVRHRMRAYSSVVKCDRQPCIGMRLAVWPAAWFLHCCAAGHALSERSHALSGGFGQGRHLDPASLSLSPTLCESAPRGVGRRRLRGTRFLPATKTAQHQCGRP